MVQEVRVVGFAYVLILLSFISLGMRSGRVTDILYAIGYTFFAIAYFYRAPH